MSGSVFQYRGRPHLLAMTRDITDRKRAEKALRESEARYRSLTENFPNGVLFLFDENFRYLAANGKAFARAGLTSKDVVGKTVAEVFPEHWDFFRPYHEATLRGEETRYEVEYGGRIYSNQCPPVVDDDGGIRQGIVVIQDVADVLQMQSEKAKLEAQFHQAQRMESIGRLAGGVAHDLNNLIAPILGYGEDVALKIASAPSLPLVHADVGQLEQVIMNLAVNAQDAMPDGGELTIETVATELDGVYAADRPGVTPGPYVMMTAISAGHSVHSVHFVHPVHPVHDAQSA